MAAPEETTRPRAGGVVPCPALDGTTLPTPPAVGLAAAPAAPAGTSDTIGVLTPALRRVFREARETVRDR